MDRPQWTSLSFHVKKPCASAELERSPPPYASPPWPLSLVTNSEEQIGPTNPRLPALQRKKKRTPKILTAAVAAVRISFFLSFFPIEENTRHIGWHQTWLAARTHQEKSSTKNLTSNQSRSRRKVTAARRRRLGTQGRSPSRADRRRVATPAGSRTRGLQV